MQVFFDERSAIRALNRVGLVVSLARYAGLDDLDGSIGPVIIGQRAGAGNVDRIAAICMEFFESDIIVVGVIETNLIVSVMSRSLRIRLRSEFWPLRRGLKWTAAPMRLTSF
jgi:hypothetical protein